MEESAEEDTDCSWISSMSATPFLTVGYQLGTSLVPVGYQLGVGYQMVTSWIPVGYQLGTSWVPGKDLSFKAFQWPVSDHPLAILA